MLTLKTFAASRDVDVYSVCRSTAIEALGHAPLPCGRFHEPFVEAGARIHFDRPEKLNALSLHMKEELKRVLNELASNDSLRAVIITGAGERAFCAGTDIADMSQLDEQGAKDFAQQGQRLGDQLERFPVPVIAAINGIAAGLRNTG